MLLLQLIAGLPGKYGPFCLMMMETAARSIELWNLKWSHVDFREKAVHVPPAKNSDGRTFGMSQRLITLLKNLPVESEYVFRKGQLKHFREGYLRHRKRLVHRLANPDIYKCSFKTYRDFVGTWVFEETGSKSEVAMWLGHRRESSTTPYIVRKKLAPKHYHSRVAHSTEEEIELSNLGYEYVKETRNGDSLWRKRKR
jgi:integrase